MSNQIPAGMTQHDGAHAKLQVTKLEHPDDKSIYMLRKEMVINGVMHVQFVWINQQQLRSVGIDLGL